MRFLINRYLGSITLLILAASCSCYASATLQKKEITTSIVLPHKDTLVLVSTSKSGADKPDKKSDTNLYMPWVSALIIAIFTVATNVYISYNARRTSLEINRNDFNKTVLSGNRQIWITEFRNLTSEIISQLAYFMAKETVSETEFKEFSLTLTKAELLLSSEDHSAIVTTILKIQNSCSEIMKNNPPNDELEDLYVLFKNQTIAALKSQWDLIKKGW